MTPQAPAPLSRGLTLGKFAPFHNGHRLLIDTALTEVAELIVLIYDAPDVTDIPLCVRSGWIRRLYPTARVVEVRDGPQTVGYEPELMRRHEACVLQALAGTPIDAFYSSEPYGEHISRALGARDRRVDEARRAVPVSGTQIRAEPYRFRKWLAPEVYRDLVVNVALLGAPCTGKTTLAARLAQEWDTRWMPEYGREYWERHQVNRRLSSAQLVEIAREHVRREDALLQQSRAVLFSDTNALTTLLFAQAYHGSALPELVACADRCRTRYDMTLVCADDIPSEATWDRSGAGDRTGMQCRLLAALEARSIPHLVLHGAVEARVRAVRRVLEGFTKYGDAAAALARGAAL